MTHEQLNLAIKERFFQAMSALVLGGHSIRSICAETHIDRRNLATCKANYKRVPTSWLSVLCTKYGVSAEWFLLGVGKMFK